MGNWYEYDIKSQKDLALLMERAKRPIVVTCGKILDLSVVTFTMVDLLIIRNFCISICLILDTTPCLFLVGSFGKL
jgi:hypothetical protein